MTSLSELATPFLALSSRLRPLLTKFVKSFSIQALVGRLLKMTFLSLGFVTLSPFMIIPTSSLLVSLPSNTLVLESFLVGEQLSLQDISCHGFKMLMSISLLMEIVDQ